MPNKQRIARRLSHGFSFDKLPIQEEKEKNMLLKCKPSLPGASSKAVEERRESAGTEQTHADTK